ncbi:Fe2+-dependent dioxygenase [Aquabacter spiritensis]|uniref:PKHD-type hydroxylase n=1 Tax=Aquabacter spiritensis TaxID=933073 RepID=A0A4R3LKX6_9HYPH|nr:Fe2+-dependent dioxygenase [Aquabacter spiritensis]TCT00561.1 PKHD-type hydroxylase [Aquabacter spiritensis]
MMIHIPNVLTRDQVLRCRQMFERVAWVDGRVTAGPQTSAVKRNLQIPEDDPEGLECGQMIVAALYRTPLFMSAVLPHRILPPMFNRYDEGMTFGSHVDNAIRRIRATGESLRTDVSTTLFLSDPEDYDGGELVAEDTYGEHAVKLPAGDAIIYPATSLHHVTPVTRGARISSFFWTQSLIRDPLRRGLLFDMDMAIMRLNHDHPGHASAVQLTGVYHNLLRQWSEV